MMLDTASVSISSCSRRPSVLSHVACMHGPHIQTPTPHTDPASQESHPHIPQTAQRRRPQQLPTSSGLTAAISSKTASQWAWSLLAAAEISAAETARRYA